MCLLLVCVFIKKGVFRKKTGVFRKKARIFDKSKRLSEKQIISVIHLVISYFHGS